MNKENTQYHLAQINIGKVKGEMDTEIMHGFASRLDEINALAESSPGFIWRLQDDGGDATSIRVYDDPLLLVNMSVWEDIESLKNFVYKSLHTELLQNRNEWFNKMSDVYQCLWWVPQGYTPSIEEGQGKIKTIQEIGPSEQAFTFSKPYPPKT